MDYDFEAIALPLFLDSLTRFDKCVTVWLIE